MFSDHAHADIIERMRFVFDPHELYLVGGIVRDRILGRDCDDLDFTTPLHPNEVKVLLESQGISTYDVGEKFGTIGAVVDDLKVEITTFRGETYRPETGRHPEVVFGGSLKDDLARRDFTINAIAYDVINLELVDPYGGAEDIKTGVIRAVGDPLERFNEDPLRMMRACRFMATLGFYIDRDTYIALIKRHSSLRYISMERIRDEFVKGLMSDRPTIALTTMIEAGLLSMFAPEIVSMSGCPQPKEYHKYDVYRHTCETVKLLPKDLHLRLAGLLHDIGKPRSIVREDRIKFPGHAKVSAEMARDLLTKMKFPSDTIEIVSHLCYTHMIPHDLGLDDRSMRRFAHRHALIKGGIVTVPVSDIVILASADAQSDTPKYDHDRYHKLEMAAKMDHVVNAPTVKSPVSGHDLMQEFDLKPGPIIGRLLTEITCAIIDGELHESDRHGAFRLAYADLGRSYPE